MFLSELSQGEAGVAFEVLAEGRLVGESEAVGQLLEGLVGGEQHVLYFAHHEVVENLLWGLPRLAFANLEEVAHRDVHPVGIIIQVALRNGALLGDERVELRQQLV